MNALVDCRMSQQAVRALEGYGHRVIPCPPHPVLDGAVASHPDMLFFPVENGIFSHASYQSPNAELPLIPMKTALGGIYPQDVLLNAAVVGKYLVCRPDKTAPELLEYAQAHGMTVLPVRQGYAKCNTCVVSERAVITEDASIARALKGVGADVLLIAPGHVSLSGYPYGFIGGASGNDGEHVFFCGSLALHPEGARMAEFCKKHQKKPISLADHALCDLGSILFF